MSRFTALTVTAFVVVATLAGPAAALSAPAASEGADALATTAAQNETNASDIAPGEFLSGVLGVTEAEVDGEMKTRTFGVKVAQAATAKAKAEVVAEQLGDIEQRLAALQDRKERLNEARENGTLSAGEYRAKMATLAAQVQTVKRLANASNRTAASLPADVLAAKGINVSAIQTLKTRADQLTGPQVAKIARSIAGPSIGTSIANEKAPVNISLPEKAGPPDGAGPGGEDNESEGDGQRGPPDGAGPGGEDNESEGDGQRGGNGERGQGEQSDRGQGDDEQAEDTTTTTEKESEGSEDTTTTQDEDTTTTQDEDTTTTTSGGDGNTGGGNNGNSGGAGGGSGGQGQSGNSGR